MMKNLKRKRYDDDYKFKYSEIECPICMEEMKIDSRSVTAPCMHEFCLHCIGKWLMESSSRLCPLCKQLVKKIMYSIENKHKYSIIGFPTDFCAGWIVRNKMKSVFDDFDNILNKIYGSIKNLFEKERFFFDKQILPYLVWFANVQIRLKSRETADEVLTTLLVEEETDLPRIKDLLHDRLSMIFKATIASRIISEIYIKKKANIVTVKDILQFLEEYIDPEKLAILKVELQCHMTLSRDGQSSVYMEYYIPLSHENIDTVLFTDDRLIDDKMMAALITKVLCSFNFIFEEDRLLVAHVNIIHTFCSSLEYCSSYEKLLILLSEAIYFILHSNSFYKNSKLKNEKQIQSALISNKAYNLVKHCFNIEDFNHITQSQKNFEKQYIYIEPVLVEDSSSDDELSSNSSENVVLTYMYVEISDSDDDALEVLSVQGPVFDLTDDFPDQEIDLLSDNRLYSCVTPDIISSNYEISESSTFAMSEPPGFSDNIVDNLQPSTSKIECATETIFEDQEQKLDDSDSIVSECVIDGNRLDISFIYQPRSAEDFYQYLLSENSNDQ